MASPTSWDESPAACFADFVRTVEFVTTGRRQVRDPKPLSDESAAVYKFMFGKFAGWIAARHRRFSDVTAADLNAFIALHTDGHRDLNSKIAYRYLRLFERCFAHLQCSPNPATAAIVGFDRNQLAQDAPMTALTRTDLQRFLDARPAVPARGSAPQVGWKRRRDRAMQLVMALAGLRVAEAIGLLVDEVGRQVRLDGSLELSLTPSHKHATSHPHNTILPAEGVAELEDWLAERRALGVRGSLVFPANLAGDALDKTTVYRQVRATFVRAGVLPRRTGGRTLRNTFALQQLEAGTEPSELKQYLGVALEESAEAYRHARRGGRRLGGEGARN